VFELKKTSKKIEINIIFIQIFITKTIMIVLGIAEMNSSSSSSVEGPHKEGIQADSIWDNKVSLCTSSSSFDDEGFDKPVCSGCWRVSVSQELSF
jgi:hypothetical protein